VATPTAAPSDRIEEQHGDVTFIRTDKELPPVAIIDRSPIRTRHKVIFGIIALLGAIAWAVIAFFRGETVNAVWFVIAAFCTYVIGFRFYARLIEMKIVRPRDDDATPAELFENGTDYMPTDRRVLYGHHFAAIAGPGPLVGPVLAAQFGYLPGTLWILIGAVFGGCVQDFVILLFSVRRDGKSLTEMAREEIGRMAHESLTQEQRTRPAVLGELSPYLTDLAEQTQPLVGRENELDRLMELLCRLTKKNPVLVGEPGVGKRTIVAGLARRIADGAVPQSLAEKPSWLSISLRFGSWIRIVLGTRGSTAHR